MVFLQVSGLQCTLSEFKLEVEKNQSLIQNLERAGQEKDSQIQELTRRMQAYQVETDQTSVEKLELLKNIQALRREADDQQRRIVELVKINEELLEFAQSKEDEVPKQMTLLSEIVSKTSTRFPTFTLSTFIMMNFDQL